MPTRRAKPALDPRALAIMAEVNKEYGAGTLVRGSQIHYDTLPRITTGSLSLDVALGGGWTANTWHEIYGDESSGKTTLLLKMIAANQALDPEWTVFWIASEHFVPEFAVMLGCDIDRMLVMDTQEMETAYGACLRYLESQAIDCVVIDSMPALIPLTEDEGAMGDQQVGLAARLNGKFFRKANTSMRRSMITQERQVTGFVVNQWREKIGVMWGDPRTTPGGRAKNYWYFTRLELKRDDWITIGTKENKVKVGIAIKALVAKNKTAPPNKVAVVDFYFSDCDEAQVTAGNYDVVKEMFAVARHLDIIRMGGGGMYSFGDQKWKGAGAVIGELRYNLTLRDQVTKEVMSCVVKGKRLDETVQKPAHRQIRRVK